MSYTISETTSWYNGYDKFTITGFKQLLLSLVLLIKLCFLITNKLKLYYFLNIFLSCDISPKLLSNYPRESSRGGDSFYFFFGISRVLISG
jgi:hypothetical protein